MLTRLAPAMALAAAMMPALTGTAMSDQPHAVVKDVGFTRTGDTWTISVTILSDDTGWDHYADGWRVETPGRQVLATRVLAHPHVGEQPFTRSQGGIHIPEELDMVLIRTSTNTEGWAERALPVALPE